MVIIIEDHGIVLKKASHSCTDEGGWKALGVFDPDTIVLASVFRGLLVLHFPFRLVRWFFVAVRGCIFDKISFCVNKSWASLLKSNSYLDVDSNCGCMSFTMVKALMVLMDDNDDSLAAFAASRCKRILSLCSAIRQFLSFCLSRHV